VGSCGTPAPARLSSNRRLVNALVGGRNTRPTRAEGLHSPGRRRAIEQIGFWHRRKSVSAGADGGMGRLRARKRRGLTPRGGRCSHSAQALIFLQQTGSPFRKASGTRIPSRWVTAPMGLRRRAITAGLRPPASPISPCCWRRGASAPAAFSPPTGGGRLPSPLRRRLAEGGRLWPGRCSTNSGQANACNRRARLESTACAPPAAVAAQLNVKPARC